jgi:farnesyl diphosphate synthase
MSAASLGRTIAEVAHGIEAELDRLLPAPEGPEARLWQAMRHATLGGGKRLRAFLVTVSGGLFGVPVERTLRVGAAVEMVHGYSLVHDDLPAMDDATTRRGRPACHVAFDEATAILAGDALQALAFEVLAADATHPDPAARCALLAALAEAVGPRGMCAGQQLDLEGENTTLDLAAIEHLEALKTGRLMGFCGEAGAILGGAAALERARLQAYGRALGLAFQIRDDLIDATASAETAGKDVGRDAAAGKATFVSLLGIDGARRALAEQAARTLARLEGLGAGAAPLRDLVTVVSERSH